MIWKLCFTDTAVGSPQAMHLPQDTLIQLFYGKRPDSPLQWPTAKEGRVGLAPGVGQRKTTQKQLKCVNRNYVKTVTM